MFVKPHRPVRKVFIHCTASDVPAHDNIATIDRWHKDRGWSGIGYHFLIHKSGEMSPGRSLEIVPAAQAGYNTGSIAVCLHGLAKDKFTEAQFATLRKFSAAVDRAYNDAVTFHGHCEVAAKACPVFDYRKVLALDARGQMPDELPPKPGADSDDIVLPSRTLRRTPNRTDAHEVRLLQTTLNEIGYGPIDVDGWFYNQTAAAVRRFQTDHFLVVDGVVGAATWEALTDATSN